MKRYMIIILAISIIPLLLTACLKADRDNPHDPANITPETPTPPPGYANTNYQIFVNGTLGDDANDGTVYYEPVKTLARAIEVAAAGDKIAVAEGTYSETITLAGESIYGGFPDDLDWSDESRDPAANVTTILDIRESGGTAGNPIAAILVNGSASNDTVIDGFTIKGGEGAYVCAIKIDTDTIPGYTLLINNNIIDGGKGTNEACGIYNRHVTSGTSSYEITISNNSITGGSVNTVSSGAVWGIYCESNSTTDTVNINIWNNTIFGGNITVTGAGTGELMAIYANNRSPKIYNNTMDAGTPSATNAILIGIRLNYLAKPSICNNIILFSDNTHARYGIYEEHASSDPVEVKNNAVYNAADALYYDDEESALDQVADNSAPLYEGNFRGVNWLTTPVGVDNVNDNPQLVSATNMHFTSGSPSSITEGGKILPEFSTDKDGNPRTADWSIGAYEKD